MSGNSSIHAVDDTNTIGDGSKVKWIPVKCNPDGSLNIVTKAGSENAYGNHPEYDFLPIDSTAANTSAGTAIFASGDISVYNQLDFTIVTAPTTGINIYVSYDGTNFEVATTDRLAIIDKTTGALVTGATLATTTAGSFSIRNLLAKNIEIRQVGAGTAGKIRGALGNK